MAAPIRAAHFEKMKFNSHLLSACLRRQNLTNNKIKYRCYHMQRNNKIRGANHHLFKRYQPALVCSFQAHRLDSTDATKAVPVDSIKPNSTLPDSSLADSANYIPEPPPIPKSILDTLELNALGEPTLQSLGLGKFSPAGFVQQALEFFHVTYGIPWWGTIAIGTVIVRLCLFPIYVYSQRITINMSNHMPTITRLQERMTDARIRGDQMEAYKVTHELIDYMKRNNLKIYKSMLMPIAQFPIFLSWFGGLRGMTYLPVESMKTGGLLWFTDLTKCDPYFILPLFTASTMAFMLRWGSESMPLSSFNPKLRVFFMAMPVAVFFFTGWFPSALSVYWALSNTFSLIQFGFLRIPAVRKMLKIPERIQPPVPTGKKKGFFEGFKHNVDNTRLVSIIQERQRLDSLKFQNAGQGAVPKTYDYNPKDQKKVKQKQ